ncbi:MAG: glutaminyl-peptide cyclotransferase [Flavobacteriaceae bacterium]|nr:glutaminyl-peptide cyclotransferase [Flavobacteriaceae bacterium]
MRVFKFLSIILLSAIVLSCGSNSNQKKNAFSIVTNVKGKTIANNETLNLSIKNNKNHVIDSVLYTLNEKQISNNQNLDDFKLGKQIISAKIYFEGKTQNISSSITILNSEPPKVYTYKILNEYPHDITSYTQGLEFFNGELYESTGQRGESKLRKVNYKTGEVLRNIDLAKEYFGEGLTILNNNIYQLTWQSGVGFVYDLETFDKKSSFNYGKSKEGWGLCNDGKNIYKSDGTDKIWTLNPDTLVEQEYIQTYTNKGKIVGMNELEWIEGKIYANRYQLDGVAIINPKNGAVEGVIDFRSLKKKVTQHKGLDVLNGIAYNPETKTLFVTGKRWDKLFEIEIIEQ